jgi:bacillithiol biosynthesis deacetylase BshB1
VTGAASSTVIDLLAIGAHPDDVELACAGTIAKVVRQGMRAAIVHLTKGEAGTRGTTAEREAEALESGRRLGVAEVVFGDCGDGDLRTGRPETDWLIGVLRRLRPRVVLAPPPLDRHPDHGRAHRLVTEACFYAGLRRRGEGDPHRPAAVFHYMQHDSFEPDFVVDVTAVWEHKQHALDAYSSQLHQPGRAAAGPATKVSTPGYRLAVEGRARHFGQLVGVELAEAFGSRLPLLVDDPLTLVHRGVL